MNTKSRRPHFLTFNSKIIGKNIESCSLFNEFIEELPKNVTYAFCESANVLMETYFII